MSVRAKSDIENWGRQPALEIAPLSHCPASLSLIMDVPLLLTVDNARQVFAEPVDQFRALLFLRDRLVEGTRRIRLQIASSVPRMIGL